MNDVISSPQSPNMRFIFDSYAEKWPSVAQRYSSIEFGPVTESYWLMLPLPLELAKRPLHEQWDWLRDPANEGQAHSVMATWGTLYARERNMLSARIRRVVIERVNQSIDAGLILAPTRDPITGMIVNPPPVAAWSEGNGRH